MKASELHLVHFRSARDITLHFDERLNLLVGANGAGKTSILDSIAILLSWAAARLRSPRSSGRRILDTDIHNEKTSAMLELACQMATREPRTMSWRLAQTRKGRNPDRELRDPLEGMTHLAEVSEWAAAMRDAITQDNAQVSIPLFVYYPVNRSVLDIPLRIRKPHSFDLLDAYEGALTVGTNFRVFFEWFRNREDLENERFRHQRLPEGFRPDGQLTAVRTAISSLMPDFSEISVKRNPLRMEVKKAGETLRVDQMSDGEKCLFALAGDLARRLAIANPGMEDPLGGEGIVLIDEVDLHLHPSWQRIVINRLTDTFPNCQFILTSHSPEVITHVHPTSIKVLTLDRWGLKVREPEESYGKTADRILEDLMGLPTTRPNEVAERLSRIYSLIDQGRTADAKAEIERLREDIGDDPELVRARVLITRKETIGR